LQGVFQCKGIKKALKTKNLKTATISVKLLSNELFRVVELMRSGVLTKKQMHSLVREFFTTHLKNREYLSLMRNDKRDEDYRKRRVVELCLWLRIIVTTQLR
jgi:hypothetical protein